MKLDNHVFQLLNVTAAAHEMHLRSDASFKDACTRLRCWNEGESKKICVWKKLCNGARSWIEQVPSFYTHTLRKRCRRLILSLTT